MGVPGRRKSVLEVTETECEALERAVRRRRSDRNLAFRAQLILDCASGMTNTAVAQKNRTSNNTVGKWRTRFVERRLEGIYDEPRPGAPRQITDDQVEEVVVQVLETKPDGRTHWSTRKMAKKAGVSQSTVSRIWRAHALKPHIIRNFKISPDPQFIEKVRDIVGLYLNPPCNAVVYSLDEKPQTQALQRAQPILPMDLGTPERQTHNYIRHGTLDLFAAINVATGQVIAKCKAQHRAKDFISFLRQIEKQVEPHLEVHIILDNLSTHKTAEVHKWLLRNPRFHFHFTPTYASWLNLIERFFGLLTEEALRRGSHTSIPQLRQAIYDYVEVHNEEGKPFRWVKTADEILESVGWTAERILRLHRDNP